MNDNQLEDVNMPLCKWKSFVPDLLICAWVVFLGGGMWWHVLRGRQYPAAGDPLSYLTKAYHFWAAVKEGHPFNPFNLEPTVRPPGTILVSYPFGFVDDFHGFLFRTVFFPILLFVVAVYLVMRFTNIRRVEWGGLAAILLFSSMPMFFAFEMNNDMSLTRWGLVDNFQAGLAALAMAMVLISVQRLSILFGTTSALLAGVSFLVKPSGGVVMAIVALCWLILTFVTLLRIRQVNPECYKRSLSYSLKTSCLSTIIYAIIFYFSFSSKYFSLQNLEFGKKVINNQHYIASPSILDIIYSLHWATGEFSLFFICVIVFCYIASLPAMKIEAAEIVQRTLVINLILFLSVVIIGIYTWIYALEGSAQTRYFFPFLLMAIVIIIPIFMSVWEQLRKPARALAFIFCALPSLNIAAILVEHDPSAKWQYLSGVNVTVGRYKEQTDDAIQFLREIESVGSKRFYVMDYTPSTFSFLGVFDYNSIVHPEKPNLSIYLPLDWVNGFSVRLNDILTCDYILIGDVDEYSAKLYLEKENLEDFYTELKFVQSWLYLNRSDAGLQRVSGVSSLEVYAIADKAALKKSFLKMALGRRWGTIMNESIKKLEVSEL